ncbi:hypothetical protein ACQEVC_33390 [Plantactinospora sp. CA-294935]
MPTVPSATTVSGSSWSDPSFDDPNLVLCAVLVPVMRLGRRPART